MTELTEAQAKALAESKFWEPMSHRERAEFQLFTRRLCMPFSVFHEAMEKSLGRPVWTHEFADQESLQQELMGHRPPPSFDEIMNMIPAKNRIVVVV
jgi:hypothetical protein